MQEKFRLYRRPNGMFYAEQYQTRHRESLQTKDEAEARRLIAGKNQAATQPVFNREMAKVYLKAAHDPQFCGRTWSLVSDDLAATSLIGSGLSPTSASRDESTSSKLLLLSNLRGRN